MYQIYLLTLGFYHVSGSLWYHLGLLFPCPSFCLYCKITKSQPLSGQFDTLKSFKKNFYIENDRAVKFYIIIIAVK